MSATFKVIVKDILLTFFPETVYNFVPAKVLDALPDSQTTASKYCHSFS